MSSELYDSIEVIAARQHPHLFTGLTAKQYQEKYGKKEKPLKFRNKPTVFANIKFQSKKEIKRYKELLLLEQQGLIIKFERQIEYSLLEAIPEFGFKEKYYRSDFVVYNLDGTIDVEDVKSKPTRKLQAYRLHKHMMYEKYKILIKEK